MRRSYCGRRSSSVLAHEKIFVQWVSDGMGVGMNCRESCLRFLLFMGQTLVSVTFEAVTCKVSKLCKESRN
jgi:hypothetical protein